VVAISSLAAVVSGGRLIGRLYFRRASDVQGGGAVLALAPALISAVIIIGAGLAPAWLLRAADAAAALHFGDGA